MRQTKPVSITLPPALIAALARASAKTGLTRSHLVRQAITYFLKTPPMQAKKMKGYP